MKTETKLLENVPIGINEELHYVDIEVYRDLPESGLELLRKFKELPLKYQKKVLRHINRNYSFKSKKPILDISTSKNNINNISIALRKEKCKCLKPK